MKLFDLSGRVALVTGGTRGIGAAIAQGLRDAGATVWIHGAQEARTKKIAEEKGFQWTSADLTDISAIRTMVDKISDEDGRLDILINNAGCEHHEKIGEITEETWDTVHTVNMKAPLMLLQALLPLLQQSAHASVINMTSIHQLVPMRQGAAYCMSKASLEMFTKVSALELADKGVRVNNLAPGAILTDINREVVGAMPFDQWIPLGRVGTAEEVVGPAIFLASDASSYMTGATLFIDGGYKENLLRY